MNNYQNNHQKALERIKICKKYKQTKLKLCNLDLAQLPRELFDLTHLEHLFFGSNRITILEPAILNLHNLKTLRCFSNYLEALPPLPPNLEIIDLSFNRFRRAFPTTICHLRNLRELNLTATDLENIPEEITHLQKLTHVEFKHNHLKSLPEAITRLPHLQNLDLAHNQIAVLPPHLVNLNQLEFLNLSFNRLTHLPDWITSLDNLKEVNLNQNPIKAIPAFIETLEQLKVFNFKNGRIKYAPKKLGKFAGEHPIPDHSFRYNVLDTRRMRNSHTP